LGYIVHHFGKLNGELEAVSHQGRVLHPPNRGFVAGRDLQWLLVSICGAAFSVGWAIFLIPRGRVLFLCYVGG
jgi:hypothetical protein